MSGGYQNQAVQPPRMTAEDAGRHLARLMMLGQKIGLEKFEKELLKKANRSPTPPSNFSAGQVRWSVAQDPARW